MDIQPFNSGDINRMMNTALGEQINEFDTFRKEKEDLERREKLFVRKTTLASIFIGIIGVVATIATVYLLPDNSLKVQEQQLKELRQLNLYLKQYLIIKNGDTVKAFPPALK